jgi:hypothetical protein
MALAAVDLISQRRATARPEGKAVRCRSRAPPVLFVPRLDRVEHPIEPPAHLRDPLRVPAPVCTVEIAQQSEGERGVLKQHGANARCVIVRRARPLDHATPAVLGEDGRERLESAREWWALDPRPRQLKKLLLEIVCTPIKILGERAAHLRSQTTNSTLCEFIGFELLLRLPLPPSRHA